MRNVRPTPWNCPYISQPMFTLVLVLVLGVSVLDVLEYLIGENAKYLYLITST